MNCIYKFYFKFLLIFSFSNLVSMEKLENENIEDFLTLAYQEFDQTPDSGWRKLVNKNSCQKEFEKAGNLIIKYLLLNKGKNSLSHSQKSNLYFHSGQMFALANDNIKAIECFKESQELEASPGFTAWCFYIKATICFLEKDKSGLASIYNSLKNSFTECLESNLDIVKRMVENPGKTYAEVYFNS